VIEKHEPYEWIADEIKEVRKQLEDLNATFDDIHTTLTRFFGIMENKITKENFNDK
jgi:hypothetical protein